MLRNPDLLQYVESKIKCQFIWKWWLQKKGREDKYPCRKRNLISSSLQLKECGWQGKHLIWTKWKENFLFLSVLRGLWQVHSFICRGCIPLFPWNVLNFLQLREGQQHLFVLPRTGDRWIKADKWMLPSASWGGTEIREQVLNCLACLLVLVMRAKMCSRL